MKKILSYKNNFWNIRHLLLLLLLTFLCYWPFTFGIFSAKNDNITQFLPVRFHVSEALLNGHLPLWSPYLYLGYPIHGDMQGGAWNPVVWLISVFGRYNVASLHWEILISIFLAGAGMYRLLGIKNLSPASKLIGAGVYLMCGYITDVAGSNLPFLWAAAYIPFVLAYYYHLLVAPAFQYALKTSIALSLLFVSAYPSFFIITIYILLAGLLVICSKHLVSKNYLFLKKIFTNQVWMGIAFIGLSAVAIFSYLHVLPFYSRGSGVTISDALVNSYHPSNSISFVLPTVPIKNPSSFATDLISRNSYFNFFLFLFLICYIRMRKTLLMNFTLAGVLFFYLFSLGDFTPIRALCYKVLPLMDTFRHPSNARLFVIIGSIVASVIIFDHFKKQKQFPKYFQIILIIALIAVLTSVIFFIGDSQIGSKLSELLASKDNLRIALKNFFAQLSVNDVVFLCGILQVIFLLLFLLLQRRITFHRWLPALFLINSFVFAQLTIPYTLASKVSPSKINALLNDYPKGYPKPDKNASLESNSLDALSNLELAGISGFYNKKINTTDLVYTPTFISSIGNTMADSFLKRTVLSNPYAYFAQTISSQADTCFSSCIISNDSALFNIKNPSKGDFELKKFWNNGFQFRITVKDTAVFCLQQLYLPGWKCSIDGRRANLHSANGSFMAVVIPKGFHDIKFIYKPAGTLFIFIFSILSWIIIIFLLIKNLREQNA